MFRKKRTYLILLICLIMPILLTSCKKSQAESIEFPLEKNGLPKKDTVILNKQAYSINKEDYIVVNSKKDQTVTIVLPKVSRNLEWVLDERLKGTELKSRSEILANSKRTKEIDGHSPYLEVIRIEVKKEDAGDIKLKLVDNTYGDFDDLDYEYFLTIGLNID